MANGIHETGAHGLVSHNGGWLYGGMEFSRKLRWLMRERGFSQERLAERLDVSQGLVSHWCKGKNIPSLEVAIRLASTLDVSLDALFDQRVGMPYLEHLKRHHAIADIIGEIGPERAWRRLVHAVAEEAPSGKGEPTPAVGGMLPAEVVRDTESTREPRPTGRGRSKKNTPGKDEGAEGSGVPVRRR